MLEEIERLLIVELWLSYIYGSDKGAMVVALTETMPIKVRTSGLSVAYSLSMRCSGAFRHAPLH
jgi:MFS transporter, MHS family, citrate/tricarballylate:H+ symporter